MKIQSLVIEKFKDCSSLALDFKEGLNVICEENEQQQAAIVEFIKAMLYGNTIDSGEGSMCFNHCNNNYRIERVFGKNSTFKLINLSTKQQSLDYTKDIGHEILDISSENFGSVCYDIESLCAPIVNVTHNESIDELNNFFNSGVPSEKKIEECQKITQEYAQIKKQIDGGKGKNEAMDKFFIIPLLECLAAILLILGLYLVMDSKKTVLIIVGAVLLAACASIAVWAILLFRQKGIVEKNLSRLEYICASLNSFFAKYKLPLDDYSVAYQTLVAKKQCYTQLKSGKSAPVVLPINATKTDREIAYSEANFKHCVMQKIPINNDLLQVFSIDSALNLSFFAKIIVNFAAKTEAIKNRADFLILNDPFCSFSPTDLEKLNNYLNQLSQSMQIIYLISHPSRKF